MTYTYGDILTLQEMAEIMQISEQTAKKLLQTHQIEFFKIGSRYRVTKEAIQAFILKRQRYIKEL